MTACKLMVAILVTLCTEAIGQTSFWPESATPSLPQVSSTASITLGLKFYSDVSGFVTGVRFYKGPGNTGIHVGALWSSTGTRLATVNFSAETASGWQQANFSSAVSIAANTTYTISYTAPNGGHAHEQYYSWSNLSASSLHVSGSSPGVYIYGAGVQFPTTTWSNSNYWVDVVFNPATGQTSAPTVSQTSFWLQPAIPGLPEVASTASVTLGLKFYSDVPGSVTGVRFYKGPHNTGTHVGALWSSTGTKLATVNFSAETASGWQQANFSSPVTIAASKTYVISYTAPMGSHAHDQYYSWSNLNGTPLHTVGSSPGVYTYGTAAKFPTSAFNSSNYWVDVVFSPATNPTSPTPTPTPTPTPVTYSISGNVRGSGASLTLSGAASRVTAADGSGNYSFTGLPAGSYIVAASQSGYMFTPSTASAIINTAPVTGLNFTSTAIPAPVPHTVALSWSTSSNVIGYNVYRADVAGGTYVKVNAAPVAATSYVDSSVASGRTYYYVATALDSNNSESTYSSQAIAVVPTP